MLLQTQLSPFPVKPLGELIAGFEAGVNYPPVSEADSASPWRVLKISAVTWGDFNPKESKPIKSNTSFNESIIVKQGDLLMSRANTTELVGAVAIVRGRPSKLLLPDKIWRIKFHQNSKLLPEYTLLALRQPEIRKVIGDLATGSSGSMQNISMEKAATIPIPLPPIEEQKRIATIAQKADRLRRSRRYTLELSDSYLRSVFLEMFGDPVTNSIGWDLIELSSVGNLDRGRSKNRPRNAPELFGGPYPFIQTGDVSNCSGYIKSYKQTYSELGLKQSKLWAVGTLCITIAANIAKTGILTFEACFPDSVVGFTPNNKTRTEYVQWWFSFIQKNLEETAPESAQKNINLEILRDLYIPLPPLPLQEKFVQTVQRFERLRTQQREAERQAEHLFQTILHRAFRGEL